MAPKKGSKSKRASGMARLVKMLEFQKVKLSSTVARLSKWVKIMPKDEPLADLAEAFEKAVENIERVQELAADMDKDGWALKRVAARVSFEAGDAVQISPKMKHEYEDKMDMDAVFVVVEDGAIRGTVWIKSDDKGPAALIPKAHLVKTQGEDESD